MLLLASTLFNFNMPEEILVSSAMLCNHWKGHLSGKCMGKKLCELTGALLDFEVILCHLYSSGREL